MQLSNKLYDRAKDAVLVVLPGLATLCLALGTIWSWDAAPNVAATITAVTAFLGAALKLSGKSYANSDDRFSGTVFVNPNGEDPIDPSLSVEPNISQIEMAEKDELVFKVRRLQMPPSE